MSRYFTAGFMAFSIMTLAGCASEPTLGDRIKQHGEGATNLGNDWNRGNDLVIEGEELRRDGKEDIAAGHEKIKNGERKVERGEGLIEKGRNLKEDSERKFEKLSF